ncbi:ATP-binding protein [Aeromonas bivalvium]|uniref:ATP-binding protein n=1 Tax=Aeromonas bivalvium TaxID=440079 RepID=UPI0038CFF1B7
MTRLLPLCFWLLAGTAQAMVLPLPPSTLHYVASHDKFTFCYPALVRPPYLEEKGGFLMDQLDRLASTLPVPLVALRLPNWQAVGEGLQSGRCDLVPHIGPTPAAALGRLYSRPVLESESAILYRGKLNDAVFLTSPLWQQSARLSRLYPKARQQPLADPGRWFEALKAGEGSAYLGDYLQLRHLMRQNPAEGLRLHRLRNDDWVIGYRLMMKDRPELKRLIDTGIRYLTPGALYQDLERYLVDGKQTINPVYFTDEEQAWLAGRGSRVRLAVNPDLMPYSGVDEQGQLTGWSGDVLRWVGQQTGLRFDIVVAASREEALARLRHGEVDMMTGLLESPRLGQEFAFSRTIAENRFALVSPRERKIVRLAELRGERVLVPTSLYDPDMLSGYGNAAWVRVRDVDQGLAELRGGKADWLLSELYQLQYPLRSNQLAGLNVTELHDRFALGFAINRQHQLLANVLDQGLMTLNNEQMTELTQRWHRLVLTQQSGVSYWVLFGSVLLALLISAAVITLIWRSRQQLSQEMAQRLAAEQALAIESRFRESLFQALPVPVFLRDGNGDIIKRNKRGKRLEARYPGPIALPPSEIGATEGELTLGERVFSYAQIPLRLDQRGPAGELIALSDISSLRERERFSRQAERRLRALTNTVPGMVVQFVLRGGRLGEMEFVSRGSFALLGVSSNRLRREPLKALAALYDGDRRRLQVRMPRLLAAGEPVSHALRYRHPTLGLRWLQFHGRGRRLDGGEWRVYGVVLDATMQVEQELALQRSHARAEQAMQAKGRFLAAISHEIRTPMNAILGWLEWLAATPLSDEQQGAVTSVRQAGDELLGLLNDVLDFSRNESGKLSLTPQPTDLVLLCERVAAVHWPKARNKGLQLRLDLCASLPAQLELDPHRLGQVLHNLLSNAIKFSHRGSVCLWADLREDGDEKRLRIGVDDEGPGIAQELMPRLFAPFEQGEVSGQLRAQGTGLGLAICRQLIEQMGGHIAVSPNPGGGSRFIATLPLGTSMPDSVRVLPATTLTTRLPEGELARLQPWFARLNLILVAPGDGVPCLAQQQDEQGLLTWIWQGKSWIPGTLVSLLQEESSVDGQGRLQQAGEGLRVLLVEDHDMNRALLRMQLGQLGARVWCASQGQQALAVLAEQEVDLVLTDLQMPVMDGAELCQQLKGNPSYRALPVYVITADVSELAARRLASCGCDGRFEKPLRLVDLAALLRRIRRASPRPEEGQSPSAAQVASAPWTMPALSDALIALYVESTSRDIEALAQALARGDGNQINSHLHKMRGAAKMVAADPLLQAMDDWHKDPAPALIPLLRLALDETARRLTERQRQ